MRVLCRPQWWCCAVNPCVKGTCGGTGGGGGGPRAASQALGSPALQAVGVSSRHRRLPVQLQGGAEVRARPSGGCQERAAQRQPAPGGPRIYIVYIYIMYRQRGRGQIGRAPGRGAGAAFADGHQQADGHGGAGAAGVFATSWWFIVSGGRLKRSVKAVGWARGSAASRGVAVQPGRAEPAALVHYGGGARMAKVGEGPVGVASSGRAAQMCYPAGVMSGEHER